MIDISNAKKRFMFNEQRRLYDAISEEDSNRLAGIFGVKTTDIQDFQLEVDETIETALNTEEIRLLFEKLLGKRLKILVIGDSNTSFKKSYINLIKHGLKKSEGIDIIDTSIPGLASMGVLDHLFDQVMVHEFDLVLVMIGTNDVRRHGGNDGSPNCSFHEYTRNINEICSYVGRKAKHVVGINIPPICSVRMEENFGCNWGVSEDDIEAYNAEFTRAIEKENGTCIDLYHLVGGVTDESVLSDGLHIHPSVHELLAKKVLEEINRKV